MPLSFEHRPSLVAYLTCGDPNLDTSRDIALAAIEAGADVIELGVPFSDPVADGPVIQRASERALRAGTTLQKSAEVADAGIDGALITDLPVEESRGYLSEMQQSGLATVFLAAPTSTDLRLKQIAQASSGFVYAVSRTGVTGPRQQLPEDAPALVRRLRKYTKLPVAVGFGISTPEQFSAVGKFADAAVVGSAIVQTIERNPGKEAQSVAQFVGSLVVGR